MANINIRKSSIEPISITCGSNSPGLDKIIKIYCCDLIKCLKIVNDFVSVGLCCNYYQDKAGYIINVFRSV